MMRFRADEQASGRKFADPIKGLMSWSRFRTGNETRGTIVWGFRACTFISVRARGDTMHGMPFECEQTLTAVAVPGGDR